MKQNPRITDEHIVAYLDGELNVSKDFERELLQMLTWAEDIRVEPGVRESHPYTQASTRKVEVEPERSAPEEEEPLGDTFELEATSPSPPAPPVAAENHSPKPSPTTVKVVESAGPPIRLDTPVSIPRPSRSVVLKPRDLVIPRSVVASWSVLVLAAVGFSFAAGLLIGHNVWRLH